MGVSETPSVDVPGVGSLTSGTGSDFGSILILSTPPSVVMSSTPIILGCFGISAMISMSESDSRTLFPVTAISSGSTISVDAWVPGRVTASVFSFPPPSLESDSSDSLFGCSGSGSDTTSSFTIMRFPSLSKCLASPFMLPRFMGGIRYVNISRSYLALSILSLGISVPIQHNG